MSIKIFTDSASDLPLNIVKENDIGLVCLTVNIKDRRIEVIDSKGVTLGQGLLVYYANELKKSGKNIDEIVKWIVDNRTKVQYAIILDDLQHLKRGGRISGTTAAIGGLLGVKPTLKLTKEGRVVPGVKLKGRKKAINYLLNEIEEKAVNLEEQIVFIAHSDCKEDANALREKVTERYKFKDVILNNIGPVIGTHTGPDALAVIFIGNERD